MFFFIAGVQPRTVKVDEQTVLCPSCGLYRARMKRVDHCISIFFLPVARIKKGEPFLECAACGQMEEVSAQGWDRALPNRQHQCGACGKQLEQGFRFCPFCGKERSS